MGSFFIGPLAIVGHYVYIVAHYIGGRSQIDKVLQDKVWMFKPPLRKKKNSLTPEEGCWVRFLSSKKHISKVPQVKAEITLSSRDESGVSQLDSDCALYIEIKSVILRLIKRFRISA